MWKSSQMFYRMPMSYKQIFNLDYKCRDLFKYMYYIVYWIILNEWQLP